MSNRKYQSHIGSDELNTFKELEAHVGKLPPDEAWVLYFVSSGAFRENVARAVKNQISRGNKKLLKEFPEFTHFYRP